MTGSFYKHQFKLERTWSSLDWLPPWMQPMLLKEGISNPERGREEDKFRLSGVRNNELNECANYNAK